MGNTFSRGYTNSCTLTDAGHVSKVFHGSSAELRCDNERICLKVLEKLLPVPKLIFQTSISIEMQLLCGQNGEEKLEEGQAEIVLYETGRILRRVHEQSLKGIAHLDGNGPVLVHGDFGPQNLLFSEARNEVVGILDWEWAHFGNPVEDLAWVEWIIRTHHPGFISALSKFFEGYGTRPSWAERKALIIERCELLRTVDPIDRGSDASRDSLWLNRIDIIKSWTSLDDDTP